MSRNRLADASSPYLLQHKDQPIHWRLWNRQTLAEAKKENKPIFLSIGYAACHWCHVMAHESFEDSEIASLMNSLFIPIKVDREERPEIDAHYMEALHDMGQRGGWPLTMFLTPDGEPFWGGTYFPKEARGGMPGLKEILVLLGDLWARQEEKILKNHRFLKSQMEARRGRMREGSVQKDAPQKVAELLASHMDMEKGGTKGAPKFPQSVMLDFLWRMHIRHGDKKSGEAVLKTLEALSLGGIYDHLGGGIARYAVDEDWRVPHFEKMLYDNALFLGLLTEVYREHPRPLFRTRIEGVAGFLLEEMRVEGGAFAASLDADQEGEEGRFYVWKAEEMDALLGEESAWVKSLYDVAEDGHWEGVNTLHRLHQKRALTPEEEARLEAANRILLKARGSRTKPPRDDKILADWNGMAIAALARAAFLFEEPDWMEAASSAFSFICKEMVEPDGALFHAHRLGKNSAAALAEDYAQMIHAALTLYETRGGGEALRQAIAFAKIFKERHWDEEKGGYRMSAFGADDVPDARLDAEDGVVPSANGLMLHLLPRLFLLTGDASYAEMASRLSSAFGKDAQARPISHTTWLSALETSAHPISAVLVAKEGEERPFQSAVASVSFPDMLFLKVAPDEALPQNHPASGKGLVAGRAAVYICVGARCALPLTDGQAFRKALLEARHL